MRSYALRVFEALSREISQASGFCMKDGPSLIIPLSENRL
jgi:hypothetical protein